MNAPAASSALGKIEAAFTDFQKIVKAEDRYNFSSTTLGQVRQAALEIERQLAARQSLRNMKRLQPLFVGLGHYSASVDVLCNGTPFLPWIWAPVKLMLTLAVDYVDVMESLIDAYAQIAETLPRFDQLGSTFKQSLGFQDVLAIYYADILSFHKETYKFLRRPGWHVFFTSSWGRFRRRCHGIIDSLRRHADLVDKQANAQAIVNAERWREEMLAQITKSEKEKASEEYRAVLDWLGVKQSEQPDMLDMIAEPCHPGSCDWVTRNAKMKSWLRDGSQPFLWVTGKPGAGKSVIASQIINFLQSQQGLVGYYLFSHRNLEMGKPAHLYRCMLTQLLQRNDDLLRHVYDEYVMNRKPISAKLTLELIALLMSSMSNSPSKPALVRIVIDGIDECEGTDQESILRSLLSLTARHPSGSTCKILLFSRDTDRIHRLLRQKPIFALSDESANISLSIGNLVQAELTSIRAECCDLNIDEFAMQNIRKKITMKSDGMFLWVKLVLSMIRYHTYNVMELEAVVDSLPKDLPEFYRRLLLRMKEENVETNFQRICRIFEWIAYSKRPLQKFELMSVIDIYPQQRIPDHRIMSSEQIVSLCKPFVEEYRDGTLCFSHSSVLEFFTHTASGPLLNPATAHLNQALSMISYLRMGLHLIDPGTSDNDRLRSVAHGGHAIHPYASQYWIEYLRIITTNSKLPANFEWLKKELRSLASDVLCIHRCDIVDSDSTSDPLPSCFDDEDTCSLLAIELSVREEQKLQYMRNNTGLSKEADTPLGRALREYYEVVRALLAQDSVDGVPHSVLDRFKKNHSATAFPCHYHECSRTFTTFASEHSLREHENAVHISFSCDVSGCKYGLNFRSQNALGAHVKKYHSKDGLPAVPKSIKGKDLPSTEMRKSGVKFINNARISGQVPSDPSQDSILIRSDQVQELAHLTDGQKSQYVELVGRLWQVINNQDAQSAEYQQAYQGLSRISKFLMKGQELNGQGRLSQAANAAVQGQPVQLTQWDDLQGFAQLAPAIQQKVNSLQLFPPPEIGNVQPQEWLPEARLQYGTALQKVATAQARLDAMHKMLIRRQSAGGVTEKEMQEFENRQNAAKTLFREGRDFLNKFMEQQKGYKARQQMPQSRKPNSGVATPSGEANGSPTPIPSTTIAPQRPNAFETGANATTEASQQPGKTSTPLNHASQSFSSFLTPTSNALELENPLFDPVSDIESMASFTPPPTFSRFADKYPVEQQYFNIDRGFDIESTAGCTPPPDIFYQ